MARCVSTKNLMFLAALQAWAVDIPIANAGFEQVVLPCAPGINCNAAFTVAGWTGSGIFSTFKPPTGPGGIYTTSVPDGVNVAALGNANGGGTLTQTLGATLQPNTNYTLDFSVGSRSDMVFAGYRVELLVGSTTVASDTNPSPPSGTFVSGRVLYSSVSANPAMLGQPIGIRLTGNNLGQAHFDKISLDATPSIITSSASQIASGGGWKTTLTIVSLASAPHAVRVAFRGDEGSALTLPLVITQQGASQAATVSSLDRNLEPGAMLVIESEGVAGSPTLVGWAEVISGGPVSGFAIFRQRSPDGRDSEGTAPLDGSRSSGLLLPFDNTAGFNTGAALVNLTNQAVIVNALIRDDNGAQIGLQAVSLPAVGHTSFALPDRFSATRGRRGMIEFQNTAGAITGLGLRFSSFGSFTSVPVTGR